jgi:hypothetical protein
VSDTNPSACRTYLDITPEERVKLVRESAGKVEYLLACNTIGTLHIFPVDVQREILGLLLNNMDPWEFSHRTAPMFGHFHPDVQEWIMEFLKKGPLKHFIVDLSMTGYCRGVMT